MVNLVVELIISEGWGHQPCPVAVMTSIHVRFSRKGSLKLAHIMIFWLAMVNAVNFNKIDWLWEPFVSRTQENCKNRLFPRFQQFFSLHVVAILAPLKFIVTTCSLYKHSVGKERPDTVYWNSNIVVDVEQVPLDVSNIWVSQCSLLVFNRVRSTAG